MYSMADVFINPSRMETLSAAIGSIGSSVKWQDAHNITHYIKS